MSRFLYSVAPLYDGNHFANHLTEDDIGNVYISDSFSPEIHKIDSKDQARVFAEHDMIRTKDIDEKYLEKIFHTGSKV